MKNSGAILKITILVLFGFSMSWMIGPVHSANDPDNYEEGRLLKIKDRSGAAVYQIGADGKKYVFPDEKTFKTYYDDFSDIEAVDQEELDSYVDGGIASFAPGTRLITHPNTAKVYAVGDDAQLYHVPDEATAAEFYGENWANNVQDVDPGIFSTTYTDSGLELSSENLPDGTLVEETSSEEYFIIESGDKRPVKTHAYMDNKLYKKSVVSLTQISQDYETGDDVKYQEAQFTSFTPQTVADKFVVICHKGKTIKVSQSALQAHLNHGDTQGECSNYVEPTYEDLCDNRIIEYKNPAGGTYYHDIGLDLTDSLWLSTALERYRIKWDTGYWSPWFTKGVDDIDPKTGNTRMLAYFDTNFYQVVWCQTIDDDAGDISCANPAEKPVLLTAQAVGGHYWQNLGLSTSTHPEIKKYNIRWFSGAWNPTWYYPGTNDVDWVLDTRRVWSYFDDHEHKYYYCPSEVL